MGPRKLATWQITKPCHLWQAAHVAARSRDPQKCRMPSSEFGKLSALCPKVWAETPLRGVGCAGAPSSAEVVMPSTASLAWKVHLSASERLGHVRIGSGDSGQAGCGGCSSSISNL